MDHENAGKSMRNIDLTYAKGYMEGSIVSAARMSVAVARELHMDVEKIIEMADMDSDTKRQVLMLAKNI